MLHTTINLSEYSVFSAWNCLISNAVMVSVTSFHY